MSDHFDIAGYCRISVDEELDRDNVSIENQKSILDDFVRHKFPGSTLTFYEDRDKSGYTFEQRDGYQAMRRELMSHRRDILVIKDFSRFSRRNSRGLVELEDLRDAGVRIISVGDGIDFPNDDDWLKIQFQFLINEMPVTDTSKKVKSVIKRRQEDGKWICAAPYGYMVNKQQAFEVVPTEADIVRQIFARYIDGWGYMKIANYLTSLGIPTPRMSECSRKEAAGGEFRRKVKSAWSIATIQGILDNDFYIGTLRQGKYTRKKINGSDMKRDITEQLVFENHHPPIVDYRTFATAKALREKRTSFNYRGVKINDNVYSGFLFCGDCGSPMFAMSRKELKPAYTCGTYHRQGLKGCTSHHIRVDKLDELLKSYLRRVRDNSSEMLRQLNTSLVSGDAVISQTEQSSEVLSRQLEDLQEELKITKRQRVRDLIKHPEQEAILEETYDEMESDLVRRMEGIQNQIALTCNKRNTMIQVNRAAKTAMEVFDNVLNKDHLERNDLELIINSIRVYTDHIEVQLAADIDSLLRCGTLQDMDEPVVAAMAYEVSINFKSDIADILHSKLIQSATRRPDKVYDVNVINDGDPLEIYTSRDGEVIFKKYSLLGGVEDFAGQLCESVSKSTGAICAVTDRDSIVAVAGGGRKELLGKHISPELEEHLESRKVYQFDPAQPPMPVSDASEKFQVLLAAPILSEGDLLGAVVFIGQEPTIPVSETEYKLAQTIASFMGKHMES
ncbi:MAG: stage V sporulation T C-terminal domain-containing protein [Oscillibacter sp.]|nr:stage V sporulation T C-terminal domain-containing protein [Oscillibacter sp.]